MIPYNQHLHTIQELETLLEFHYVPRITFESLEEEQEIRRRGMAQWESNQVSQKALALGSEFRAQIEEGEMPKVSIRRIDETVGHGLFAEEDLNSGCYAGEYTGVVRRDDLRRFFRPLNHYLYEYPVPDPIGKSYVIDAEQGNLTRFINHSETPNLKPHHVFYDGYYHLIFLTLYPIPKGTQLCYNYGKNYWHVRSKAIPLR